MRWSLAMVLVLGCTEPASPTIRPETFPEPIEVVVEVAPPEVAPAPIGAIEAGEVAPPVNEPSVRARSPRHASHDEPRPARARALATPGAGAALAASRRTNGAPSLVPPPPVRRTPPSPPPSPPPEHRSWGDGWDDIDPGIHASPPF